jgi:transposase-like protein
MTDDPELPVRSSSSTPLCPTCRSPRTVDVGTIRGERHYFCANCEYSWTEQGPEIKHESQGI